MYNVKIRYIHLILCVSALPGSHECLWRSEEGVRPGVRGGVLVNHMWALELNPGPLEEQ